MSDWVILNPPNLEKRKASKSKSNKVSIADLEEAPFKFNYESLQSRNYKIQIP